MDYDLLRQRVAALLPHLDERSQRLYLGAEAKALGYGGVSVVARLSGYARNTIEKGMAELGEEPLPDRVRRTGAGRTRLVEKNPELLKALKELLDLETRGDPMSPLLYTSKSTDHLAEALTKKGYPVSADTVGRLLDKEGYSLQVNRKTREGSNHPDRNKQFKYIKKKLREHQDTGQPVISVDTKKKEIIGNFKNAGKERRPKKHPEEVGVHDFPLPYSPGDDGAGYGGKAIPYGIYDEHRNEGWVNVGCDHDTSAFAVASIRSWWEQLGRRAYSDAKKLLICADGGGSNGYRVRLWKLELAKFAQESGLTITVCHLPPGTSKWNKIEHRLFSYITMNWAGKPLTTHQVVVDLIGATTTKTGLTVGAARDTGTYPKETKVTDEQMAALPLKAHRFHGEWNYTLNSKRKSFKKVSRA
jgi:transposase